MSHQAKRPPLQPTMNVFPSEPDMIRHDPRIFRRSHKDLQTSAMLKLPLNMGEALAARAVTSRPHFRQQPEANVSQIRVSIRRLRESERNVPAANLAVAEAVWMSHQVTPHIHRVLNVNHMAAIMKDVPQRCRDRDQNVPTSKAGT